MNNKIVPGSDIDSKKYKVVIERWKGIGKLVEETGELQQVLGKLLVFPEGKHPDGDKKDLRERLIEELADVYAALDYFTQHNLEEKDLRAIIKRSYKKHRKFQKYNLPGV